MKSHVKYVYFSLFSHTYSILLHLYSFSFNCNYIMYSKKDLTKISFPYADFSFNFNLFLFFRIYLFSNYFTFWNCIHKTNSKQIIHHSDPRKSCPRGFFEFLKWIFLIKKSKTDSIESEVERQNLPFNHFCWICFEFGLKSGWRVSLSFASCNTALFN